MPPVSAKPCARCGSPVADAALGRGAVEGPDGKRYCSPCAAEMVGANQLESAVLKAAVPKPSKAAPPARRPSGAAPRPVPARRTSGRITPVRPAPKAVARGNGRSTGSPPSGQSARRTVSSRAVRLPWYFRLQRWHLALIAAGVVGLLLAVALILGAGGFRPAERRAGRVEYVYSGPAHELFARGKGLARQGKTQEAIKCLQAAKEAAAASRDEDLQVEINKCLYQLRKFGH